MDVIHRLDQLETPGTVTAFEYGVAYWNGKEVLVDYASCKTGRDDMLRDYIANFGADNVRRVKRAVVRTPDRPVAEDAEEYCECCGDFTELKPYRSPAECSVEQSDMVYHLCSGCKDRPQNRDLIAA